MHGLPFVMNQFNDILCNSWYHWQRGFLEELQMPCHMGQFMYFLCAKSNVPYCSMSTKVVTKPINWHKNTSKAAKMNTKCAIKYFGRTKEYNGFAGLFDTKALWLKPSKIRFWWKLRRIRCWAPPLRWCRQSWQSKIQHADQIEGRCIHTIEAGIGGASSKGPDCSSCLSIQSW